MYYPRYRPERRSSDWIESRSRRTRSEDFSQSNNSQSNNSKAAYDDSGEDSGAGKRPLDLVEETLKEIRSRKLSDSMSINGDSRRLSCEEIDQVLNQIRSRSASLSSRPPPPKSSPPPLPEDLMADKVSML
jgi:hypothetical protein